MSIIGLFTKDKSLPSPSPSSQMGCGRGRPSICSDIGRGRARLTGVPLGLAASIATSRSSSVGAECPSAVASSTLTIGRSMIDAGGDNDGSRCICI